MKVVSDRCAIVLHSQEGLPSSDVVADSNVPGHLTGFCHSPPLQGLFTEPDSPVLRSDRNGSFQHVDGYSSMSSWNYWTQLNTYSMYMNDRLCTYSTVCSLQSNLLSGYNEGRTEYALAIEDTCYQYWLM